VTGNLHERHQRADRDNTTRMGVITAKLAAVLARAALFSIGGIAILTEASAPHHF
jgi:hypothetical protein